jgi:hypothetical protein
MGQEKYDGVIKVEEDGSGFSEDNGGFQHRDVKDEIPSDEGVPPGEENPPESKIAATQKVDRESAAELEASAEKTRIVKRKDILYCPSCGRANPLSNYFCSGCGKALKELEIKDHRHELEREHKQPRLSGAEVPTSLIRRTTAYLGSRISHIQPVRMQFSSPHLGEIRDEDKGGGVALVVGITIVSLLVVAAIVLLVVIIYNF